MEAHALGAGAYRDHVVDTVRRWHRDCLPNFDDVLAPGATIIQLIMDGDLPAAAGDRMIDLLEGLPTAYGAVPALEPHRPPFRNGLCIDLIYHLPATYAQLARWKGDQRFADKAVRIALDCMRILRCQAGGRNGSTRYVRATTRWPGAAVWGGPRSACSTWCGWWTAAPATKWPILPCA